MSKKIGIPTYVIASNQLAGEYLVQVLASDRFARPILCEQLPHPRLRSATTVFVIEGSAVPVPLRECIRQLQSLFPKGKFVMVDKPQLDEEILLFLKLGFHGFVEHSKVAESLAAAVRAVAAGRLWISDRLMHMYMRFVAEVRPGSAEASLPTFREIEVLELVRQRLSNREIATLLAISENTVKYHLSNILAKFQVSKRRELETTPREAPARIWEQLAQGRET